METGRKTIAEKPLVKEDSLEQILTIIVLDTLILSLFSVVMLATGLVFISTEQQMMTKVTSELGFEQTSATELAAVEEPMSKLLEATTPHAKTITTSLTRRVAPALAFSKPILKLKTVARRFDTHDDSLLSDDLIARADRFPESHDLAIDRNFRDMPEIARSGPSAEEIPTPEPALKDTQELPVLSDEFYDVYGIPLIIVAR